MANARGERNYDALLLIAAIILGLLAVAATVEPIVDLVPVHETMDRLTPVNGS